MLIETFFPEEHIIFLEHTEKQHVIKEMLLRLEGLNIIPADRYYAQVMHRESLENTGIGSGFAIPHARTDTVDGLVSIFGVSAEGIDYLSFDKNPVKYVLLNIFPTSMSTGYLYLVGMMARIFSNSDLRKQLDTMSTPAEIYSLLKKESHSYFDAISQNSPLSVGKTDELSGIPSYNLDLLIRLERLYNLLDKSSDRPILQAKIDELKKLINNKSLKYYERMRSKCLSPFAILDKHNCSGCHMELAPVYIAQVKEQDSIALCNHCGRFLVIV